MYRILDSKQNSAATAAPEAKTELNAHLIYCLKHVAGYRGLENQTIFSTVSGTNWNGLPTSQHSMESVQLQSGKLCTDCHASIMHVM